jgi:hypothetical protein
MRQSIRKPIQPKPPLPPLIPENKMPTKTNTIVPLIPIPIPSATSVVLFNEPGGGGGELNTLPSPADGEGITNIVGGGEPSGVVVSFTGGKELLELSAGPLMSSWGSEVWTDEEQKKEHIGEEETCGHGEERSVFRQKEG